MWYTKEDIKSRAKNGIQPTTEEVLLAEFTLHSMPKGEVKRQIKICMREYARRIETAKAARNLL